MAFVYLIRAVVIALLNVPIVWHYIGLLPAAMYLFFFVTILVVSNKILDLRNHKWLILLIGVSFSIQLICLFGISPHLRNGMDRDSGLMIWNDRVLAGKYPYDSVSRNGNPISVLPFAAFMALPFHKIGNVGLLEPFSYLCLIAMLCLTFSSNTASRFHAVFAFSTAPLTFFEVVARSDLIATMMILLSVMFVLERTPQRWGLLGFLLGCALSTRIAIYPALLILILQMSKRMTSRAFLFSISVALLTASVLILPFILWNPSIFIHYAPIGVNLQKLGPNETIQYFWISAIALACTSTFFISKFESVYLSIALILAAITFATWSSFVIDLSYLQLVAIPFLFAFPRSRPEK